MRVCQHGCDVKMFCFSSANHASKNLKKFLSSKLDKFTLFTHSFVGGNLENRYKQAVSILFSRENQNILTPQPCLHSLMQTLLSANQSARTILVVL